MAQPTPTYYDVLRVAQDTSSADIRAAYRRMAQRYHPDRRPDNPHAAARAMAAINAAYAALSDEQSRAEHDRWISQVEQAAAATLAPARRTRYTRRVGFVRVRAWPWCLLFATIAVCLGTLTTVVYLGHIKTPARAPLSGAATATAGAPVSQVSTAAQPRGSRTTR